MNLTLFPVAAFLLLLSGFGAPAHTAGQTEASAALMRVLLGQWDTVTPGARTAQASLRVGRRTGALSQEHPGKHTPSLPSHSDLCALPQPFQAAPAASDQKHYRTRFGFADGAYLAVGPPVHGLSNGLDWPRA